MPVELRLEARDCDDGPARWRWVLTDASGTFIADHEVRLDESSWQYEAFADLRRYISWHAAPDRYAEDEARIVAEVGEWTGTEVFGPVADALAKAARKTPVTVRVVVPDGARGLLFRPLELARAHGRPLTAQDVTLVMQTAGDDSDCDAVTVGDRLRILGLFSLPEGGQPLNLRRERHALVRLINRIAAHGKVAEVRVLQYGVTRERLREILEEAAGWDVIHVAGHGAPGELLLETAAGTPDRVTAAELADLLEPAREHVKLVTLAACWSAAMTAVHQRRLLGLPLLKDKDDHSPERIGGAPSSPGNFATELTGRLGCAVLAMRYPVADEFAIELSEKLYVLLVAKGQPLARAVGMTVKELTAGNRFLALSAATPALFGGCAARLTLAAPKRTGPPSYGTGELKMAGFPPQPERFVGRTGVMARSSAALADESGIPGMLLHGMPGGGKTACALELAYTHEHAFDRLVWYKAPDEGAEISGALTDFAVTLERCLEGFHVVHLVSDVGKLAVFLPRLTELMERSRLLLVIDNAESLLTETGRWRDGQWGQVISALTAHRGLGRVIVTSRRVPREAQSISAEPVDALSADEALLLARELPHLRDLVYGDLPGIDRRTARELVLGVLTVAQGHPKLLELADGQATSPERLAGLVTAGGQAWRQQGGLPDGFFTTGESAAGPSDYLNVLAAWTRTITDTLSPAGRDLFWFLCCLEELDRIRPVLDSTWTQLRTRLGRDGQASALEPTLAAIAAAGLAGTKDKTSVSDEEFPIHPGIAAAGRAHAGKAFRDAVDTVAAGYWDAVFWGASGTADGSDVHTGLVIRAGAAAAPYLMRLGEWAHAASRLEDAFGRAPSRSNAASVLPAIRRIVEHDPSQDKTLAAVLTVLDPAAAELEFRRLLAAAEARRDYRAAAMSAWRLVALSRESGHLAEALELAGQMSRHIRQAGLGPWTRLLDEVLRLQVRAEIGDDDHHVLGEVHRLVMGMAGIPHDGGQDEIATPWDVQETLLDTGRRVARRLGRRDESLIFNAGQVASMQARRAPATDIAGARFHDYAPLLDLNRFDEAVDLLQWCLEVFNDAQDLGMLGNVFGALAAVEDQRGNAGAAMRLEHDALRYSYLAGDVTGIATSYQNLGNRFREESSQPARALAFHLAAAVIRTLAGAEGSSRSAGAAAEDLRQFGPGAAPPTSLADLSSKIGSIPGTDPAALIERLSPDLETAERTLHALITKTRQLAKKPPEDVKPE